MTTDYYILFLLDNQIHIRKQKQKFQAGNYMIMMQSNSKYSQNEFH